MSALTNDRLCLRRVPPKPRKYTHDLEKPYTYEVEYFNGIKQKFLMNKDDALYVRVPHTMIMRMVSG